MNYDLKPKEYEIMKFIWANAPDGVAFGEIHDFVNSLGKKESRQRINCFIQSLLSKGILAATGEDRHKIYTPTISKQEYDQILANQLLNQLFDGSLKTFVSALSGGDSISDENAKELRKLLRERNKKK
ncbi:MAG: BlaI/MecI/CopY family transcriptional regulator [Lachnospiraceae bacterium]|nr:BlaI/MecI/CopY family transcriptional regulator [Lachnospiraceae bacterium]